MHVCIEAPRIISIATADGAEYRIEESATVSGLSRRHDGDWVEESASITLEYLDLRPGNAFQWVEHAMDGVAHTRTAGTILAVSA
jgi:hypothetical protein